MIQSIVLLKILEYTGRQVCMNFMYVCQHLSYIATTIGAEVQDAYSTIIYTVLLI